MSNENVNTKESLELAKEAFEIAFDNLNSKIRILAGKNRELKEEYRDLQDVIKNYKSKITELKLQLTKLNSSIVLRDKEISELKSTMHGTKSYRTGQDREKMKSKLKQLISRIDIHLEGDKSSAEIKEENL